MKGDNIKMPVNANTLRQRAAGNTWFQQHGDEFFHRQDSLDSDCRTESSFSPSPPAENQLSISELFNNLSSPRSSYLGNSNGSNGQGQGQGFDNYSNNQVQSPPFTLNSQANRFQFSMPMQNMPDNDSSFFADSPPVMRNHNFNPGTPTTPGTPGTPPQSSMGGNFDTFSRSFMHPQARAIRGSPPYNFDSGSPGPSIEQSPIMNSRSISPADSETSSSNFDSMSDLMASLSINGGSPISNHNLIANARNNSGNNAFWPNGLSDQELSNLYALNALYSSSNLAENNRALQVLLSSFFQRNLATNIAASTLLNSNPLNWENRSPPACFRNLPNSSVHEPLHTTWTGQMPERTKEIREYSCKIFLGGIPWEIPEEALVNAFQRYGHVQVEWPNNAQKGYCYIIFENEKQVRSLLDNCTINPKNGNYYFELPGRRLRSIKPAQVIPWPISDSNYVRKRAEKLDPHKTVFVGALHGMLTAECICNIMHDLFGGVLYAGIDTDKWRYPLGSCRVVFEDPMSYMKAVSACFINVKINTDFVKISKKLEVNPYLEDSPCSKCNVQRGPYFCRDQSCFRYFCRNCWQLRHATGAFASHQPLSRTSKSSRSSSGSNSFGNCNSGSQCNVP